MLLYISKQLPTEFTDFGILKRIHFLFYSIVLIETHLITKNYYMLFLFISRLRDKYKILFIYIYKHFLVRFIIVETRNN